VAFETALLPRPPYSLALSARMKSDATRYFRDGVLTIALEAGGAPALARVHQRPDGALALAVEGAQPDAAVETLRFVLAADDDHEPFLRRFANDPLLAGAVRRLRGFRPLRTATVTHALLKAVCGQLIQAKAARLLEARLLRSAGTPLGELRLPPTRATFGGHSSAVLAREGLVARKANALVRISREWDLERLHGVPTAAAVARIERERGLGPWSAGMVSLYGLGRFEHGLVGDLGLVKLCAGLLGRRAEPEDTRELLAPYGEWAGLASVYLLASASRPSEQARASVRGRPRSPAPRATAGPLRAAGRGLPQAPCAVPSRGPGARA
jgi:3-methyladenine DNA glycosylase/8-oxoguanine DNA glycosylase